MTFLIRMAFWLGLVIMLIPVDEETARTTASVEAQPIGAFEAVGAAQAALDDVGGFCARNPDVCDIGGRVATTFMLKARSGVKMLESLLDDQLGPAPTPRPAAAGTLTPQDLQPAWRGPDARAI